MTGKFKKWVKSNQIIFTVFLASVIAILNTFITLSSALAQNLNARQQRPLRQPQFELEYAENGNAASGPAASGILEISVADGTAYDVQICVNDFLVFNNAYSAEGSFVIQCTEDI